MIKEASRFLTILLAISAGIPIAIISGGREWFCVGSCGPMNAVSLGVLAARPAGNVIYVAQADPHGTITGEKGSSRSKWISAAMFRICSAVPKQHIDLMTGPTSGRVSQA